MSASESQAEEVEVLDSIYDGDENYKKLNEKTHQYMISHPSNEHKNFLLEIGWGEQYPDEMPDINLDAFFNKHVLPEVKASIKDSLLKEAEDQLGCAMTYTLIEFAKENVESLTDDQPEKPEPSGGTSEVICTSSKNENEDKEKSAEREVDKNMTKAQKRRMWDRMEAGAKAGDRPRGWDWMDIIKHLSQTGNKEDG